jgi:nucleoside-diphosphate-sugar epimerase
MEKVLVIGACGQLGSELTIGLRHLHGKENVIASDLRPPEGELADGPFENINALDKAGIDRLVHQAGITQIYHLAAVLSATGEKDPKFAWQLNMESLIHVLDIAKDRKLNKVYWPSSIAVFGPNTPRDNTPQHTVMDPNTIYGISKLAGERWCEYYFQKYGVDVRSLRYPGLIGYKTMPGGGTTDYAVDIYFKALETGKFECFLAPGTYLPMMYMDDAVKATIDLMEAPAQQIKVRSSYNIAAMSFSPEEIAESIRKEISGFEISYRSDFRQHIADSWPNSIDDSTARSDWGWMPSFDLAAMTEDILKNLRVML